MAERERFEPVRPRGTRGDGKVACARDGSTGRLVALTRIPARKDLEVLFERQMEVLYSLAHPGIAPYVAHWVEPQGDGWVASEWIEGVTLSERLRRGTLDVDECLQLARRLVDTLDCMAAAQVTHRDLKPTNIRLPGGQLSRATVVGLSIARDGRAIPDALDERGRPVAAPDYMSPEQANGDRPVTPLTDVFAMGSILYECLAGQRPFQAATPWATLMKICVAAPEPLQELRPNLPLGLVDTVEAMIAKTPGDRPTPAELRDAFERLANRQPGDRAGSPASTRSIRVDTEQRVVCALFVKPSEMLDELSRARFKRIVHERTARAQRMLDGTWSLLMEPALSASDQALAAADCANALRQADPGAALAMCLGKANLQGSELAGEVVDLGQQLLEATPGGSVLMDQDSAELVSARYSLRPQAGRQELGSERQDGPTPPSVARSATPFIGRARELSVLEISYRECLEERQSTAVLVTGEAGAGKSRLLAELRTRLRPEQDGCLVLLGRGEAMQRGAQFSAIAPLLHGFAWIASDDGLATRRDKLQARVTELVPAERAPEVAAFLGEIARCPFPSDHCPALRAARHDPQLMADWVLSSWLAWVEGLGRQGPVLWLLEDWHWADAASVRFLQAALRTAEELPLMVAAFARPEVLESFAELTSQSDFQLLGLTGLPPKAARRLLDARTGGCLSERSCESLLERARGNPFFIEELARVATANPDSQDLPRTVTGTVQRTLDELGDSAKLVVRAASVYGQHFDDDAVLAIVGAHLPRLDISQELRELQYLDVVHPTAGPGQRGFRFRHALLRDVAYDLLPEEERRVAHGLAARWLQAQAATPPAVLAEHCERGGLLAEAAVHYGAASLRALQGGGMDEVVRLASRSIDCGAHGETLGEAASLRAEGLSWSGGENDAAMHWAHVGTQHLPQGSEPWWRAMRVLVISQLRGGDPNLSEHVDLMLTRVRESGWTGESLMAFAAVATAGFLRGQDGLGARLISEIPRELPEGLRGRPEAVVELARVTEAESRADLELAYGSARRATAASRAAGAVELLANALMFEGYSCTQLGLLEDADRCLLESGQLARRNGSDIPALFADTYLAKLYRQRDRWDEAKDLLQRACEGFEQAKTPAFESIALAELARVQSAEGRWDEAIETATRAVELAPSDPLAHVLALESLGSALLTAGRLDDAARVVDDTMPLLEQHGARIEAVAVWLMAAEVANARTAASEAEHALRKAMGVVDAHSTRIHDPHLHRSFLQGVPEHRRLAELANP